MKQFVTGCLFIIALLAMCGLDRAPVYGVVTTTSATYTAEMKDTYIHVNATDGNKVVALPDCASANAFVYYVKKIDSSSNTVTVDPFSAQTVDGASTRVLSTQWQSVMVVCDGTNWFVH